MIPSEYRDILYVILKILNRSLKWRTVRLWTPTGSASTSRQSWTLKKTARFSSKTEVFFNVQLWRLVEADPVGVQRCTLRHFKDLFKIFKMTYSMSLYSDGIIFKFRFQKSHFMTKNGKGAAIFSSLCTWTQKKLMSGCPEQYFRTPDYFSWASLFCFDC